MIPDDDDHGAWRPVFDVHTPWERVQALIDEYAQTAIDELGTRLAADPDLSSRARAAMLARAEPLIRQRRRDTFEQAWSRLRLEADVSAQIH